MMELHGYHDILVLLAALGVVVPVFHRLRVNPVLGYLLAGILIGPDGLRRLAGTLPLLSYVTVSSREAVALFGELGVALLLFMIGIEVSLPRLMTLRRLVFGLGSLQVSVSAAVIGLVGWWLGLQPTAAAILGIALALSSTAIVAELLSRQKRMHGAGGRATFAVLLFQDLAVVPALLLIGILGAEGGPGLLSGFLVALMQALLAGGLIVLAGRFALRPFLRLAARSGGSDVFLASTLFAIVAVAILAGSAGLSLAFGAFVAGLLIAETEFRREVETIIDPFKGLFLGLFFVAVGMAIDLDAIAARPVLVLALAGVVMGIKFLVMAGLGGAFRLERGTTLEASLLLSPCGEFGFVIIAAAVSRGLLTSGEAGIAALVVATTLMFLPALGLTGAAAARRMDQLRPPPPEAGEPPMPSSVPRVIVSGYGRVGQLICSILEEHSIPYLAIDSNVDVVVQGRRAGVPVYFGDGSRAEFLRRCGIETARGLVITMDAPARVQHVAELARSLRADMPIVARARDARHAQTLYAIGATEAVPETIEASLQLGEALLDELGIPMGIAIASIHERRDQFRKLLGREDRRRKAIKPVR